MSAELELNSITSVRITVHINITVICFLNKIQSDFYISLGQYICFILSNYIFWQGNAIVLDHTSVRPTLF